MPRLSRIDPPGALHHIIDRGINRQRIFNDDADRDNFLDRLGNILVETQTACFAWSLIPNHISFIAANRHHGQFCRDAQAFDRLCSVNINCHQRGLALSMWSIGLPGCWT
jgi:hypothetical protein